MTCWNFAHVWAARRSRDTPDDARTHLSSCQGCPTSARADAVTSGARNERRAPWKLGSALCSVFLFSAMPTSSFAAVPTNGLVASYNFNGDANDSSGRSHHGTIRNVTPTSNRFRNGSSAYSFNGTNAYIEIPDHRDFSVTTTGKLSISVWMRPGTLQFPDDEETGYVY
jgi:hypothetical protein